MTEADWLTSSNTGTMLRWLKHKTTHRKFYLYGVAVARSIWHMANNARNEFLLQEVEDFIDSGGREGDRLLAMSIFTMVAWASDDASDAVFGAAAAPILREIVNPFLPAQFSPPKLAVPSALFGMAEGIYRHKLFIDLGPLANALEETGCTNAEILAHLRSPGPHVKGCWALDLVLGKE